jgi:murein DD-endopeptidase MepM/ murein hydrolase activator NlpD
MSSALITGLQRQKRVMKRASLVAAFAASLVFGPGSIGNAADDARRDDVNREEAQLAEERLLGSDDEAARLSALQLFTREIGAGGIVGQSFDASLAEAGVPAAAMLEAREALATSLDLDRDLRTGDRFYVRYERTFTAEGVPIGIGRVLWVELRTKSRGTVAIHRFRNRDKIEHFWFANGQAATPPSMRWPLDVISISSGFGLRADPFDQPPPTALAGAIKPFVTGGAAPGKPVALRGSSSSKPVAMGGPKRNTVLPPGLPTGGVSGNGSAFNTATPLGAALGLVSYAGFQPASFQTGSSLARPLFMHEGIDLVAPAGTPIYAAADGVIEDAAPNGGYGNWIRIDHGNKLTTVYGHLMAFAPGIEPGETVTRGELVGFVGSTGRSTGAHLHFEIRVDGKPVNPITSPELKAAPLRTADLERFRKQVAHSLEERDREAKVASGPAGF